ncbi:ribosomal protein S5 domain 2-like protein [Coprinopsis marcescibilis]|uniref:Ribosomal protein S5 domain 2-like protein n=1 Tax=Coprinopsis marcescibilis TaxID=230819 RepID=A0A5C3KT49_COPMA|nr:ribosomal protein S5 domain 2-like protein [Coprinopsis marcescibilis]
MQSYLRPYRSSAQLLRELHPRLSPILVRKRNASVRSPYTEPPKASSDDTSWPYPIHASERISDRKSVFLAHASTLEDASAFPNFLKYLTGSPALRRATHCMYAYRTVDGKTSQVVVGQNDGGESGSGDRLLRLLELSKLENVVVVVSRWYGGVKLGSDRWKRISEAAKQALERGNFVGHKREQFESTRKSTNTKKKR